MTTSVQFLFDFVSPNAYLAHQLIPDLERRTGVTVDYRPVLLRGVFKATGNVPPFVAQEGVRNKAEYDALETRRFLSRHRLESRFRWNPDFPLDTLRIMRGATAARRLGNDVYRHYITVMFEAMWRYPRKLDEPEIITEILRAAGLPVGELMDAMRSPEIRDELRAVTDDAVARGVFGLPSLFVGEALYFGKDRLREVEEAIVAGQAAPERCASG